MKLDCVMVYVEDIAATTAFYEKAFGLKPRTLDLEQGYAQMDTGDAALAFAIETAGLHDGATMRLNRAGEASVAVQIAFVVDDVHAAWERAMAAGCSVVRPLVERPWGQTLGTLRDLNGILIELGTAPAEDWEDAPVA